MKIAITGATGFVGSMLVEALAKTDCTLLLAGRDPDRVAAMYPDHAVCGYDDLAEKAQGYDRLVHLAVANNDSGLPADAYQAVNVDFLMQVVDQARIAGIGWFINISSTHALEDRDDPYAVSKRAGLERLETVEGIRIVSAILPLVYGARWGGRLARLNGLPGPLARGLFTVLAALKPTVHVERLAQFVTSPLDAHSPEQPGNHVILADDQARNPVFGVLKRVVDLSFVLAVAVLLWWALAIVWVLIRWDSPGPGIFAQTRVGRGGAPFTLYKFRTMRQGVRQAGTHEISAAEVTRIGAFLRRTKLDELPQIWNILLGQLSLIGPRPCLPNQTELIAQRESRGVMAIRPGISGLAQVKGIDMSTPEVLARWDARYVALRALVLDIKLILATARGGGQGDRVAAAG